MMEIFPSSEIDDHFNSRGMFRNDLSQLPMFTLIFWFYFFVFLLFCRKILVVKF